MNLVLELEATQDLASVDLETLQLLHDFLIIGVLLANDAQLVDEAEVF